MFNELTVNQIGGLFNQLYNLEEKLTDTTIKNNFLNINCIFWSEILNKEHLLEMIDELNNRKTIFSTKLNAIKSNPKLFCEHFENSINNINSQQLDSKTEFSYLETLQMVCYLHTYLYTSPFELTIYEGFKHNQYSAYQLSKDCLLKYANPYYEFIKQNILPIVNWENLDVLWIKGRPNISGFCLARLVKEVNPEIKIISIENNSEFFSFNKITDLLTKNHPLFSVYDCIVLNDNNDTYDQLRNKLINGETIDDINNIIYSVDHGNSIKLTPKRNQTYKFSQNMIINLDNNQVVNLKLFPDNRCYWDKCTFCAINKKYTFINNNWDISSAISTLKELNHLGFNKFWALDEAVPVNILYELSNNLISNNLKFHWHVRTRIDTSILDRDIPKKLKDSGLSHILFGFESASPRILQLMNKTNNADNYLEISEKIVNVFNDLRIHVHFPVIIGFPTESQLERNKTLKFMEYLQKKYPYFSYNINILNLDVSSPLCEKWSEFNITALEYPCDPYYFIGNGISWKCSQNSISINNLEHQAINSMRLQFPWYPAESLIDLISFYSMWEYSRSQLSCNPDNNIYLNNNINISSKNTLRFTRDTTIFTDSDGMYCLYNFKNHHCVRGGKIILDLYNDVKNNLNIEKYCNENNNPVTKLINDLIKCNFIELYI